MRMKICLIVMVMCSVGAFGQAPGWAWAKGGGCHGASMDMAVDSYGNVYLAGYAEGDTAFFDTDTIILNSPYQHFFIAKYDCNGNELWVKVASSLGSFPTGMAIDASGNILIAGPYGGFFSMDTIILTNPSSYYDSFFIRLDSGGNVLNAKSIGAYISDVAANSNGDYCITGGFRDSLFILESDSLINPFLSDTSCAFTAKFDSLGNVRWARSARIRSMESKLEINNYGDVYLSGTFSDYSVTFDTLTVINADSSAYDSYLVKFNINGNAQWIRRIGGNSYEQVRGMCLDPLGNPLLTGMFQSDTLQIGTFTLLKGAAPTNMFVAHYDYQGNVWNAKCPVSTGQVLGMGIVSDMNFNIYYTGYFSNPFVNFDGIVLSTGPWLWNLLVVKADYSLNTIWAKGAGYFDHGLGLNIAVDANSNTYVAGAFWGWDLTLDSNILQSSDSANYSVFVGKIGNVCVPVNIETLLPFDNVNIFPNPTTSFFTITSSSIIDQIEITDVIGQVIYRARPKDKNFTVRMEREGIYFVRLTADDETVTRKVVVQR